MHDPSHRRAPRKTLALPLLSALAVLSAPTAYGLNLEAAAEMSSRTTTNARRFSDDESADTLITPAVMFAAVHEGPGLNVETGYTLRQRFFVRDFFDDETILTGGTIIDWEALPERVELGLRQSRRETTNQSFGRGTQVDRQITNSTELRSALKFRPRETDELRLRFDQTYLDDENFDIDNTRSIATVSYRSRLSASTSILLESSQGEIDFDASAVADIDTETHRITLRRRGDRYDLSAMGGYSNFDIDEGSSAKGAIYNVIATLRPIGGREFEFAVRRTISDRPGRVTSAEEAIDNPTDIPFANSDLTDVFTVDSVSATWREQIGPNLFEASIGRNETDFENFNRDQVTDTFDFNVIRAIRPAIEGFALVSYQRSNYDDFDADFDQWFLDMGATYRVNRRLQVSSQLFHLRRNSNSALAGDFNDTGIEFSARYTFLPGDELLEARQQRQRSRQRQRRRAQP